MTTSNPFTARITEAAKEGYIGTPRNRRPRTGAGSRLAALEADQTPNVPLYPVLPESLSTPRQQAFMTDLLNEKDLTAETRGKYIARIGQLSDEQARRNLTKEQASNFIEYLFSLPRKEARPVEQAAIPAGRYAVPNHMLNGDTADNSISFFQVDAPQEGRWAGYVFVSRQAGSDLLRMNRRQQDEAKNAIRKFGYEAASRLYGLELGHCGVCGRELTNEVSRAEGIGPVCMTKMGW